MSPVVALLLVRYGELGLKSPPVRKEFERTLRRNILEQFVADRMTCRLRSDFGHLYVDVDDADRGLAVVRRVFGVTSVSVVEEVPAERAALRDAVARLADRTLVPGASFAIRARRTGTHAFTSQELARDLGAEVLLRWRSRGVGVDLDHPQVELSVEVRGPRAYLSSGRAQGPGGLPLGVAGRVTALVDGPRGALGAYLMMKRGCRCAVVGPIGEDGRSLGVLARFDPRLERRTVEGTSWRGAVADVARTTSSDGIVLPLSVEAYPEAKQEWGDRVLFSPTVGWTDTEVAERWRAVEELAGLRRAG